MFLLVGFFLFRRTQLTQSPLFIGFCPLFHGLGFALSSMHEVFYFSTFCRLGVLVLLILIILVFWFHFSFCSDDNSSLMLMLSDDNSSFSCSCSHALFHGVFPVARRPRCRFGFGFAGLCPLAGMIRPSMLLGKVFSEFLGFVQSWFDGRFLSLDSLSSLAAGVCHARAALCCPLCYHCAAAHLGYFIFSRWKLLLLTLNGVHLGFGLASISLFYNGCGHKFRACLSALLKHMSAKLLDIQSACASIRHLELAFPPPSLFAYRR